MNSKTLMRSAVMILLLTMALSPVYAQEDPDAVSKVPELDEFHEVIFKIWHEAWPEENTAMLKELVPEVEAGVSRVVSAKLPGILREKKEAWEEGIANLKATFEDYKTAAASNEDSRLMDAAEELHAKFEILMRTVRPVIKELDDFHSSLYMLYHHYLPDFDIDKIRSAAQDLKRKMQVLDSVELPERLQIDKDEFRKRIQALSGSVEALGDSLDTDSKDAIRSAVEQLHTNYQKVQETCE
ncbi:MAG: hypothetical protein P8Z37_04065 [Acidobacteriota bacterium]